MNTPVEQLTVDGYDLQFGTNVIGNYAFTRRLLPLLLTGVRSSPDKNARIVNTSSSGQLFVNKIDLDAMKDVLKRKKLGSTTVYMQSKLANVVLSNELARRYGERGIVSTSLNPGNIKTDLPRTTTPALTMLFGWLLSPTSYGALTPLWAGVSPETVDFNGKYLIPWAREGKMRAEANDPKVGETLWSWLEAKTKE